MDLTCGPVVNKDQWERINRYIQKGKDEGLVVVVEGDIADGVTEGGYFVTPTIFGAKNHDSDLMMEEIFGRSEEQTSDLKSLMRISYAVFFLKKKKNELRSSI